MGDGNAVVIKSVNAIDPCQGVTVVKEECINHVTKCMFKGLERLVRDGNAEVTLNKVMCAIATTWENYVSTCQARTLLTKSRQGSYDEWEDEEMGFVLPEGQPLHP